MTFERSNWPDIRRDFPFASDLLALAEEVERKVAPYATAAANRGERNSLRVMAAFHRVAPGSHALAGSTGYGYDDPGREAIDCIYADAFGAEAALVRPQFVSGTHALAAGLFGLLGPGDRLVAVGEPYDTIQTVIGNGANPPRGTLRGSGVEYLVAPLSEDGAPEPAALAALLRSQRGGRTVVLIQRSRGYVWRRSLPIDEIGRIIASVKEADPEAIVFVDNCYGEFVEDREPPQVGADLCGGSLIKNPGGGLAPTGGYLAGRRDLVEAAAERLTAPGLGSHVGPTLGLTRLMLQGLFLAPHVVAQAIAGAAFLSCFFEHLGFAVSPRFNEPRSDIIQAVKLGSREAVIAFCAGIQAASPVDAKARPEPWDMPGYADQVIMAAGTFVQGASIELSADAPMRPPYAVFVQGGLLASQVKLAAIMAAQALRDEHLI
ncbi:MAG: aminotransferase class I/II-fold pyridoxal phosphate-dependent enzyme [Chloroflexota bacterium]